MLPTLAIFNFIFLAEGFNMAFEITSPSFANNSNIPYIYTCDGSDISPALEWNGAPAETKSYVLIMDDPDAPVGMWDHWILFNIPADTNSLLENLKELPAGTKVGKIVGREMIMAVLVHLTESIDISLNYMP